MIIIAAQVRRIGHVRDMHRQLSHSRDNNDGLHSTHLTGPFGHASLA